MAAHALRVLACPFRTVVSSSRLCQLPLSALHRCRGLCNRRRVKSKVEENQPRELEEGQASTSSTAARKRVEIEIEFVNLDDDHKPPMPSKQANGQDPDEVGIAGELAEVPAWQMPKLVVECSRRPNARVHRGTSLIMPEAGVDLMAGIVGNLPVLLQIRPCWHLGYSMAVDGVSLRTLYRQVAEVGPCLLIIEDSNGCIFGSFLSEGLRPGNQCYGTHECFVFRYPRAAGAWRTEIFGQTASSRAEVPTRIEVPAPVAEEVAESVEEAAPQENDATRAEYLEVLRKCQAWVIGAAPTATAAFCDHTGIVIGIDGPGLFVDQDLLRGVSYPSKAFGSPCLAAGGPDFVVRNLEVWHWTT
mmetsp:Transcript_13465/g.29516  ORF Transcript_13465/g.29516 Transcript_13465/m.29516 type:complete len:359 (-) Transcript_13465:81-1157(-)